MITAVLFDLDGVLRHFDPAWIAALERERGLPPGAVLATAFAEPGLGRVITGRIARAQWIADIGDALGDPEAAVRWGAMAAVVDDAMVELIDELRGLGLTTGVLTNGTDTIADELAANGLDRHLDTVVNSADIGHAKPDPRAFAAVLDAWRRPGDQVFFTDDSAGKLAGAVELGMTTHVFTGILPLREALRAAGVGVEPRTVGGPH